MREVLYRGALSDWNGMRRMRTGDEDGDEKEWVGFLVWFKFLFLFGKRLGFRILS